ncbi:ThiF family adenylyltransferase [Mycobacterium avium]|uniref:ThiF family adenylyltransferase n=1 Tax=Mycobacterium avium TaxID=1764 RepID=UPI001CC7D7EE|nr:ThiF family adenylyltransferase [Mycobacterium avium]MBZ4521840.1 hypothetical protein [Mycobacterium avium subsp. hominissuis]
MAGSVDAQLQAHFARPGRQEDLTFAYWRPSLGERRFTALVGELVLPDEAERLLDGNVAFTVDYLARVLAARPRECGIALLHSHFTGGWQDMSRDDEIAERDRLASAVAGASGLPLLGLTWGTDGTWSARFWGRTGRYSYQRLDTARVRVVGRDCMSTSFHPILAPPPPDEPSQRATVSVWGPRTQADLARTRVGIVGLGSVGSIVSEALMRTGVREVVLIDHDRIEERNLDRTLHANDRHAAGAIPKVAVAADAAEASHTARSIDVKAVRSEVQSAQALKALLDCDAIVSCVDRPWPRWILNTVSYAHLIPVVDGGIQARVDAKGLPLHVDWRIHTAGPERACLVCLGAVRRSDAALDRDGLLDDPDYLQGLCDDDRERYNRRNVFAFSLATAAHEVLQLVGLVSGSPRIGGIGPQHYAAYPGHLTVEPTTSCRPDCEFAAMTATGSASI